MAASDVNRTTKRARQPLPAFLKLHQKLVIDLLRCRLEHLSAPFRNAEVPSARNLDQVRLAQIGFRPMHAVAEDRLLPGRQKLSSFILRQLKPIRQLFDDLADTNFSLRRGDKHRQHYGLVVWNGHRLAPQPFSPANHSTYRHFPCLAKQHYDQTLSTGREDPSNPKKTVRVLTIMLASEY
jgi:hypothetical protein